MTFDFKGKRFRRVTLGDDGLDAMEARAISWARAKAIADAKALKLSPAESYEALGLITPTTALYDFLGTTTGSIEGVSLACRLIGLEAAEAEAFAKSLDLVDASNVARVAMGLLAVHDFESQEQLDAHKQAVKLVRAAVEKKAIDETWLGSAREMLAHIPDAA